MKVRSYCKGKVDWFILFVLTVLFIFLISALFQYDSLKGSIQNVSCNASRRALQNIVEQYRLENGQDSFHPHKNIDTFMLKEKNYTGETCFVCPDGGSFRVNSKGQVYCTRHNPELADN